MSPGKHVLAQVSDVIDGEAGADDHDDDRVDRGAADA